MNQYTLSTWTKDSKLETEKQTWWPLGRCFGSTVGEAALYGPSGSLVSGDLSMRCMAKEDEGWPSHITLNSPKLGDSNSSNPNTCQLMTKKNKNHAPD